MTTPTNACTLRNERRDFPEWHLGRSHYAVWALAPHSDALRQRLLRAQTHLEAYLLDGYERQAHITVGLCGFPSTDPRHNDDFGASTLQAQIAALQACRPRPFTIQLGGLQCFTTVPYLQVDAPAEPMNLLRQCLAGAALNSDAGTYVPHLTVGLFGGVWPLAQLQPLFEHFESEPLQLPIDGITLMAYEAREIGGPLHSLAHYDFASGRLRWNSLPAELQGFGRQCGAVDG